MKECGPKFRHQRLKNKGFKFGEKRLNDKRVKFGDLKDKWVKFRDYRLKSLVISLEIID